MRLYRTLDKNLFSPPHRWLPLAVFVFVALAFLYHPQSPFRTFVLADPDDYMRLNEVINWLQGQGWHDLSHPRLSLGAHTVLHWSRLVDLPIALLMLPFVKVWGLQNAAMLASFIVPLILLGFLLKLLPALALPLVGKDRANWATVFLLFAPALLFNFTPGRVDHHGWQILVAGFGLLCLERLARDGRNWPCAAFAAVTFACGLWIGTEALPWLILFIACLALAGAWRGGSVLRNGAIFGGALVLAVAALFPVAVPPADYSSRALSWFSMADVIFAVLAGAVLVIGWGLGCLTQDKWLRLALTCSLGFCASMLFLYFVPDAFAGPFADFDVFNATVALDNINEAVPLSRAFRIDSHSSFAAVTAFMAFVRFLFLPVIALIAVVYNAETGRSHERMVWLFHGVFLLAAFLLTLFWQVRVGRFMQLFTIAPLTWAAFSWWKKTGRVLTGRPRFWAEIGVFLVLGPLPVLLVPAIADGTPLYPNLILFPAARGAASACPLKKATDYIAGPWGYIDRAYTILAGANEGPELLFRTQDNVIAANFNVPANRDVFSFFNAHEDKTAIDILRKWHVDLVLTCRHITPFYAGFDHPRPGVNAFLHTGADGKLYLGGDPRHPALIEKLINGQPPRWLKPIEIPTTTDYLLFEVKLPANHNGKKK